MFGLGKECAEEEAEEEKNTSLIEPFSSPQRLTPMPPFSPSERGDPQAKATHGMKCVFGGRGFFEGKRQ
jgi:hypothetical protein